MFLMCALNLFFTSLSFPHTFIASRNFRFHLLNFLLFLKKNGVIPTENYFVMLYGTLFVAGIA